ncbi:MAG: DUF1015 domain-containing protein [Clostridiales bacterium]|nr:DUF1015 domain-containing protein [Clostridiales bacterium]
MQEGKTMSAFDTLPVRPGKFYLPGEKDMPLWPIVACDQYTAQKDVWQQAYDQVGEAPSSLKLIIPECYLNESEIRVPAACKEMERYMAEGILKEAVNGMVLTERTTQSGMKTGLVLTVDLEDYSFARGTQSLIRPTEGTVAERIPPRLKVRRDALLELAHILILIDDKENTVLGPLSAKKDSLRRVYDQDLILNGGHIAGWAVEDEADLNGVAAAFRALKDALLPGGILLAVGDGNHSLATAKAHWENVKALLSEEEQAAHPARFATVEINNIYDDSLIFEPIHRVIFGADRAAVKEMLKDAGLTPAAGNAAPDCVLIDREGEEAFTFAAPLHTLPVGTVQLLLDRAKAEIDYVHGEDAVRGIVAREDKACGLLLPAMPKELLFPSVAKDGPLPRKTFSMGEANEKRYYMEARTIR